MKLFLTNLFLIATLISSGQTPLGLGLVSINYESIGVLEFHTDTTDSKATKTIRTLPGIHPTNAVRSSHSQESVDWVLVSYDQQGKSIETQLWLKPEQTGSTLVLRFKQQTKEWYEVIINNQTNQTYWIRKSKVINYLSWGDYLKSKREISRLPYSKQKIKRLPTEQSKEIKYSGRECFQIKSVNEDWIEILLLDNIKFDENKSKHKIKSGWIKWRNGDNILINYHCPSNYINGVKYING